MQDAEQIPPELFFSQNSKNPAVFHIFMHKIRRVIHSCGKLMWKTVKKSFFPSHFHLSEYPDEYVRICGSLQFFHTEAGFMYIILPPSIANERAEQKHNVFTSDT